MVEDIGQKVRKIMKLSTENFFKKERLIKMNSNKFLKMIVIICLIVGVVGTSAYAHRMIVDEPENGEVQVRFDDGTVAPDADVTLYDEAEEVILEGQTDQDGILSYDPAIEPYQVVASDDVGHRAVWSSDGEGEGFFMMLPAWARILLGLAILVFLAASMMFWKQKQSVNN
ncbi:hypothetical protein MWH25_01700 [Natroniella acetigena]|uniref:hypothetical protein n=1 Tax=Natroniella acetigena TaxID=52004 RepID=UPI00200A4DA9|nr:hypothetical protein [Natroniella acetigena]MCK8826463.1 hypothetical protein [Natroniella acetigena]